MTTRFPVPKSPEYQAQLVQRGCKIMRYYGTTTPDFFVCPPDVATPVSPSAQQASPFTGMGSSISPQDVTVTEAIFEDQSILDRVVGFIQEHPYITIGAAVGALYFLRNKGPKTRKKNPKKRKARSVDVREYKPRHYSVWVGSGVEDPGFLEQWKDIYAGEVYDDDGLWVGRRVEGDTDIFPSKKKATAWVSKGL